MAQFLSDYESDGEIPDIALTLRIQPYMYEPIRTPTHRGRVDSQDRTSVSSGHDEKN